MDTLILVVVPVGERHAVVPRRMRVETRPGEGRLHVPDSPVLDAAAMVSFQNAWSAAQALAGRSDADAFLSFAGATPLQGASAGLSFGLAAIAGLLGGETLPPHFATGGVATPEGDLEGGLWAGEKARAGAGLAPQRGMREGIFLAPPISPVPEAPPLRVVTASDLGSAYARLHPEGHARIVARHVALRRLGAGTVPPGWVEAVEEDVVLWRTRAPLTGEVRALARQGCALVA